MAQSIHSVAVCVPQVPFFHGGAELLAEALVDALNARGYEASLVSVPFCWVPREEIAKHCLAWRLLNLNESNGKKIDLVIGTKFPSYLVAHERKITWLFHQFRQVYDLLGTPYSDFGDTDEDRSVIDMIRRMDRKTLAESERLFAISKTVAKRLQDFNDLDATPLYPPPPHHEQFRSGEMGDYILSVGRLDPLKRTIPLIEAMRHTDRQLRCVIVGRGPEGCRIRELIEQYELDDRVRLIPRASQSELVELYSNALAVYYAPYREDFGYVTLEAFLSKKPVVTARDAGGPTEFVEDGVSGLVTDLAADPLAEGLRKLHADRAWASELGAAGHAAIEHISWDRAIQSLMGHGA